MPAWLLHPPARVTAQTRTNTDFAEALDRGKELSGHAQFSLESGTKVFFADPHSPWQRPTNENTNGLLRQYFPKGTNLGTHTRHDLDVVAAELNNRPRKSLDWDTPTERLEALLTSS